MASFTKILGVVDATKQVAVQTDFMEHLPEPNRGNTVYFPVFDENSQEWRQFGYYTRGSGHPKPVFQGEWQVFCRENRLKAGDRITFTADVGGNYRILGERKIIRLLGSDVWTKDF